MEANAIIQPVIALGLWTVVMAVWMVATRVPEMNRLGIDPQQAQDTTKLRDLLPAKTNRVSNNYNHLFEQPTLFYAVAISIAVVGVVDSVHVACAWSFVCLRVAHSLVQATVDIVAIRFGLFALSWIALAVMTVRAAVAVF